MREPEKLDFFFGNLVYLLNEAGMTKRALSVEIGAAEDFISTLLLSRQSPSLDTVYAIASVLKCDVADLLRPGPQIGVTGEDNKNYWVERTAEEYLSSALNKTRSNAFNEAPTFDAVLNWWHANDGLLTGIESFEKYIEIFETPDTHRPWPKPRKIGVNSLSSREFGFSDPDLLNLIFEKSEPDIGRAVALAHLDVAGGQPSLSVHTVLIKLTSGNVVKLSYTRLLLPVKDGNGQKYVLNYSKPVRRSEIGREQVNQFQTRHSGKPIIAGLV